MVTKVLFVILTLSACYAGQPALTSDVSQADSSTLVTTDGPTLQAFDVPSADYPYGEINRVDIGGVVPSWPADLFGDVVRVHATADCSTHDQRSGGAAFENASSCGASGTHALTNVGLECSSDGGTYNYCMEALKGDIQVDNGNVTVGSGNVFASGYVASLTAVYAEGAAGVILAPPGVGSVSIRASAGPPADSPAAGSIVLDSSTPALWMFDGATWKRAAFQ